MFSRFFGCCLGFLSLSVSAVTLQPQPKWQDLFAEGLNGTLVVHEVAANQWWAQNPVRAETRYSPASTFKIPNSLIGLKTGAVQSVDEVFYHWDGKPQYLKTWEKDMGLREAIKVSNLNAYQQMARRVGSKAMQAELKQLAYGNQNMGKEVNQFWVNGDLTITAVEQAAFLAKLAQGKLAYPDKVQADVREITLLKSGKDWELHGKTGWTGQMGWFVGWVLQDGQIYSFALNMDVPKAQAETLLPKRQQLAEAGLQAIGLMQD